MNVENDNLRIKYTQKIIKLTFISIHLLLICINIIFLCGKYRDECDYNTVTWFLIWSSVNAINVIFMWCLYKSPTQLMHMWLLMKHAMMITAIITCLISNHIWIASPYYNINDQCRPIFPKLILANLTAGWIIVMLYLIQFSLFWIAQSHTSEAHDHIIGAIDNPNFQLLVIQIYSDIEMTDLNCSICLQDYSPNDETLILKCKHRFHNVCLRSWFSTNNTCPICRYELI